MHGCGIHYRIYLHGNPPLLNEKGIGFRDVVAGLQSDYTQSHSKIRTDVRFVILSFSGPGQDRRIPLLLIEKALALKFCLSHRSSDSRREEPILCVNYLPARFRFRWLGSSYPVTRRSNLFYDPPFSDPLRFCHIFLCQKNCLWRRGAEILFF